MLEYKAERAGTHFVRIDPRNTSQDCSGCGKRVKKSLSDRRHVCESCGLVLDRDENAARNILDKGMPALGEPNVAGCGERVPENITEQ